MNLRWGKLSRADVRHPGSQRPNRALRVLVEFRRAGMQHAVGEAPASAVFFCCDFGPRLVESKVPHQVVDCSADRWRIEQDEPEWPDISWVGGKPDAKPEAGVAELACGVFEHLGEASKRDEGVWIGVQSVGRGLEAGSGEYPRASSARATWSNMLRRIGGSCGMSPSVNFPSRAVKSRAASSTKKKEYHRESTPRALSKGDEPWPRSELMTA